MFLSGQELFVKKRRLSGCLVMMEESQFFHLSGIFRLTASRKRFRTSTKKAALAKTDLGEIST